MKISMLGGLMLAAVVTVLVCADEVELNDGAVYQGEIIAESDAEVVIRTARGEKRLARRDVAAVRGTGGRPRRRLQTSRCTRFR